MGLLDWRPDRCLDVGAVAFVAMLPWSPASACASYLTAATEWSRKLLAHRAPTGGAESPGPGIDRWIALLAAAISHH